MRYNQFDERHSARPSQWTAAQLTRLSLFVVSGGLAANLLFNSVMQMLGYSYPFTGFMFCPSDRWADFFKLAFSYPGAPLHPPSFNWPMQPLLDLLKRGADLAQGTTVNPDHLPPLPTLMAVLVRKAFVLFDPMLVFLFCGWLALIAFAATITGFVTRQADQWRWLVIGLCSYPLWYSADRGHFFSLICAITLMSATRRMIVSHKLDLPTILLLAIACNLRPNAVIIPAMLVLGGQAGRFRDLIRLGLWGALVLALSMMAAHAIYPHYGPAAWMQGLADYNSNYVKVPLTHGFVTSLPSMLDLLLGFDPLWSRLCLGLAAVIGILTVLAARSGLLTIGQIMFLSLGMMSVAIPSYADYHLLPFLMPVLLIAGRSGIQERGDWLALLGSLIVLIPKNYIYGNTGYYDAWSYQIVVNPLILLAAMSGVLVNTLKGRPGWARGEFARMKSARQA